MTTTELVARTRAFIEKVVIPKERELGTDFGLEQLEHVRTELQAEGRASGLWLPHLPKEIGGLGLPWVEAHKIFIEAGRSMLGPQALNIAAPDEGNMHLLHVVANAEQKERWLLPLARGEIRSCFSMTEPPPGAGSDPSMLQASAVRENGVWKLEAKKWFISGAWGAAVTLILARTSEGATIFMIPMNHPKIHLKRVIPALDSFSPGGHCELDFDALELSDADILGEPGKGFDYAQIRLDPARLTHCMRWLGVAIRSLEYAERYALERSSFGKTLSEQQMVQQMVADSHIEIFACKTMIEAACRVLDRHERVRHEASMTKVFVSEAVNKIIDRSLQIMGSTGISEDYPVSSFYKEARPFRIYDGANEVHRMSIAKRAFRRASEAAHK
ncbi:MAG: acyl-CoA dehydrogenase family protein [Deinococcales bacterium]